MQVAQSRGFVIPTGLPVLDETNVDAFLHATEGQAPHALIFFAGQLAPRPETEDVAIVLPELLRTFAGKLRGAIVAAEDEDRLKGRFQVFVTPSLVMTRGAETLEVLPKIQDWSVYVAKIGDWLEPEAQALARPAADGRVEFVYTKRS